MDIIPALILLLFFHFVADFLFQNDWMALNKSKNNIPLATHVFVYSLIMVIPALFIFDAVIALQFACFNGILHYSVDYLTSRASSWMRVNGKMGSNKIPNISFWGVIGFDQFLHTAILILSYSWFLNYVASV